MNTTLFEEQFKEKKNSPGKKKVKSETKKETDLLYHQVFQNHQAKNRYPEIFREISRKGDKVTVIAKLNSGQSNQNPMKKFINVEKLSLPETKEKKRKHIEKLSTKTLEKELMITKKNAS